MDGDDNLLAKTKTPTTEDITSGILNALDVVLDDSGVSENELDYVMLGTTHATNAITERRGLNEVGVIRIGAPAMTTRGMLEEDFVRVADLIHKGVEIAIECKAAAEGPKLKDFNDYLAANDRADIKALREEVESFADGFHMPGGVY